MTRVNCLLMIGVWHPQFEGENASICEKVARCEEISTLNVKIDTICKTITLNVKEIGSLNVSFR